MTHRCIFLVACASLAAGSSSYATITSVSAYGDTAVNCYAYVFDNSGAVFTMDSAQQGPGRIRGWIYTDSAQDPTLTLQNTIDNQTDFAWTGYHVDVFMNQMFTLSSPSVLNSGWSGTVTAQPVWDGANYVGQLDFTGGIPVPVGQILTFSYQITFSGSTQFTFGQTMTPIPEPVAAEVLAAGGLLLAGRAFRKPPGVRPTAPA